MSVPGSCCRLSESDSFKGGLQESAFQSSSAGISFTVKFGNHCKMGWGSTNAYF